MLSPYRSCLAAAAMFVFVSAYPSNAQSLNHNSEPIDRKATEVVKQFADRLELAKSASVKVVSSMVMLSAGQQHQLDTNFDIAIERPEKISLIHKDGLLGSTIVSNGKILTIFSPARDETTTAAAPSTVQEISHHPAVGTAIDSSMILCSPALFGSIPYDSIMDGVTTGTYLGVESVSGEPLHHLHFEQEQFHWDAWFTESDPPLLVRAEILPAEEVNKRQSPEASDVISTLTVQFSDWHFDQDIPDSVFEWGAPDRNSASQPEISGMSQASMTHISSHLGRPAPDFDLPLLNGGNVNNQSTSGSVVILDFWATWCGPCRRGMPVLEEVEKHFKGQSVHFYAVNLREDDQVIERFLIKEKLSLNVATDKDGTMAKAYGVRALPTTIIIGNDGTVQGFHEGTGPAYQEKLTSQIASLLRDQNLVTPKKTELPQVDTAEKNPDGTYFGLKPQWIVNGNWEGLAYDKNRQVIIAAGKLGKCADINFNGKVVREFSIENVGGSVRIAQLDQSPAQEILTFGTWRSDVYANTVNGKFLWNYPQKSGINDVTTGDLNGDGRDEVIIGFNGETGLYALTCDGEVLWKDEELGNMWNCCTGDVEGNGQIKVLSTSALGQIHIYDQSGQRAINLKPKFYANMVRISETPGMAARIIAGGSKTGMEVMAAYAPDGTRLWETLLKPGDASIYSMSVSACGELVAVGLRGGDIIAADTKTGKILGKASAKCQKPDVGWTGSGDKAPPLIIVATGSSVNAYSM